MKFGMKEMVLLGGSLLSPHVTDAEELNKPNAAPRSAGNYFLQECTRISNDARRGVGEMLTTIGVSMGYTPRSTNSAMTQRFGDEVYNACMNDPDFKVGNDGALSW